MDKIKNDILLVSKLLSAEKEISQNALTQAYDKIYNQLEKEFRTALENSSLPKKEKIFSDMKIIIDKVEIFISYPQLLGQTLVGLVNLESDIFQRTFSSIISVDTAQKLILDTDIPALLLRQTDDKHIETINDVENSINLTDSDYEVTNKKLWRYGLDIRQWLRAFVLRQTTANLSFVYMPLYFRPYSEFNELILSHLDAIFIFASKVEIESQRNKIDFFKKFCEHAKIPIYIVTESAMINEAKIEGAVTLSERDVFGVMEKFNIIRKNYLFTDDIKNQSLMMNKFYSKTLEEKHNLLQQFNIDLTRMTQTSIRDEMQRLSNEIRKQKIDLEDEYQKIKNSIQRLIDKAENFEKILASMIPVSSTISAKYRTSTLNTYGEIILNAIEMKDFNLANNYLRKLNQSDYDKAYIYEMLISSARGETVSSSHLSRLRKENDTEFIRKAKIRLKKELGFSDSDYMQIARDIINRTTAAELYFYAMWLEYVGNIDEAINFYQNALSQGYSEAGDRLYELAKNRHDNKLLEHLAEQMLPIANYQVGCYAKGLGKTAKSITHLKIAAANGYLPAIKDLTNDFCQKLLKNYYRDLSSAEKEERLGNCLHLYQNVILPREPNNLIIKEKIGDIYHALGDDNRAFDYWNQCDTATAYYNCGRLFQYKDGAMNQDLDRAANYFKKASQMGHTKAGMAYSKVKSWQQQNEQEQKKQQENKKSRQYSSSEHYTSRTEKSSPKTSSGCIITTAACIALGKDDDCEELMILRAYRDEVKSKSPIVADLIEEYYRIAPLLIKEIEKCTNKVDIYKKIWKNYISITCEMISNKDHSAATFQYIDMVKYLCSKYNVKLRSEINNKIFMLKSYC